MHASPRCNILKYAKNKYVLLNYHLSVNFTDDKYFHYNKYKTKKEQ